MFLFKGAFDTCGLEVHFMSCLIISRVYTLDNMEFFVENAYRISYSVYFSGGGGGGGGVNFRGYSDL